MCNQTEKVQAFHDGEMPFGEGNAFELHLMNCRVCAAELEALRRLSARLASAQIPQLSKAGLSRFHQSAKVAEERGVFRLAEGLTAAAAAVLVIGMAGLFKHQKTHPSAPDTWEQAAVAFPVDAEASSRADQIQLAEWIRTDLSGRATQ